MSNPDCPTLEELRDHLEEADEEIARHLATCRRCRALLRLLAEERAPLPPSSIPPADLPSRQPSVEAEQPTTDVRDRAVVVVSSPEAPGELLVAVVLDVESAAAGADGLVVAPLSPETRLATDADIVLGADQTPLGYQVTAEVWNAGTILREQIEEQRGHLGDAAWERINALYSVAIGDLDGEPEEAQPTAARMGDGPPILDDADPRLVFQDEEIERAQRFYAPAARLLAGDAAAAETKAEERDAGALTVGLLLSGWLEEQGYEASEYAREIGFDRRHVELVCADRIDPVLLHHDQVAEILARPYRTADLDLDDLGAALSRSFDEEADWALVGASGAGRGRIFARTSGRRGHARADALRRALSTPKPSLSDEEIERRKRSYVNDVLAALEEKTGP
jgi:hypothetical protein